VEHEGDGTGLRVLTAIPAVVYAIVIIAVGGPWFAIGILPLGVVALHELYQLMRRARPVDLAGYLGLAALLGAAYLGGRDALPPALALSLPMVFVLAAARRRRTDVAWGVAATLFGVVWIGLALAHAVLLRDVPQGGALLTAVLIGTFLGDAGAYFGGRAWGRRPLAPLISPQKTVEGLVVGIVVGTLGLWAFLVGWHDFIAGTDALLIGLCVALAAPVGDLFESMVKRDLQAKDTGRFFGPHGGVLDRLDAVFFTVIVGYYASLAIL
jgi:phosphatidate cytidylyltransferase